jgi:hypothetical protein
MFMFIRHINYILPYAQAPPPPNQWKIPGARLLRTKYRPKFSSLFSIIRVQQLCPIAGLYKEWLDDCESGIGNDFWGVLWPNLRYKFSIFLERLKKVRNHKARFPISWSEFETSTSQIHRKETSNLIVIFRSSGWKAFQSNPRTRPSPNSHSPCLRHNVLRALIHVNMHISNAYK